MFPQYASITTQYTNQDWSATAAPGGSLGAGTINLHIQGYNRAGRNLLSEALALTLSDGDKLTVTLNESLRPSGSDLFGIIISRQTAEVPTQPEVASGPNVAPHSAGRGQKDTVPIARWEARETDQVALRSLPATIELTEPTHLETDLNLSGSEFLPSNPINGSVRYLEDEQRYYRFDAEAITGSVAAGSGYWVETEPSAYLPLPSAFLSSVTAAQGCDRRLDLVENPLAPPPKEGSTDSVPIGVWWTNGLTEDGGSPLPSGYKFNLTWFVNGEDYTNLFSGLVVVRFLGYVRRDNCELDVTVGGAGGESIWYSHSSPMVIDAPLPRGYAAAWEIFLRFDPAELQFAIPQGAAIAFNLIAQGVRGTPTPVGFVTGDAVFSTGSSLRVVPGRRLGGTAVIKNYQTPVIGEQDLFDLTADTAGQKVAISGPLGGSTIIKRPDQELRGTEALRAVIGTLPGTGPTIRNSKFEIRNTSASLTLTINHPVDETTGRATIRGDYDDVIAGSGQARFNPPQLAVYISYNSATWLSLQSVVASTTQTFTIFTIDDLSSVTIPVPDPNFCLFKPSSLSVAESGSGSLEPGDYEIALAYHYPSPNPFITSISHKVEDGCIPELDRTLAELIDDNKVVPGLVEDANAALAQVRTELARVRSQSIRNALIFG